jgi:hypothetical protein
VHFIGMMLLIGLMVVVSYFDLAHWLSGESLLGGGLGRPDPTRQTVMSGRKHHIGLGFGTFDF